MLEIVERLADHVGILHDGRLVAQGAISELRAAAPGETLEEIFLGVVGAAATTGDRSLEWLGT